jgi:hypothetical protein
VGLAPTDFPDREALVEETGRGRLADRDP